MCFYVNDLIDTNSWKVEFTSADMCTLKIKTYTEGVMETIHVHNVYNPSPASYSSTDSPTTLPAARSMLTADAHHILLGDFNLHHPFWNSPSRPTQHAAADQLLEIIDDHNLSLTLPKGTVTWEARNTSSTIDLVFMSEYLVERLEHCMSRPELNQSSDHVPISTRILLASEPQPKIKRRAWKLLNLEKLREAERHAPIPESPRTTAEIDAYTESIQNFLQNVINEAVPWAKSSEYAKPFWTEECSIATKATRKLRRIWSSTLDLTDWSNYMKSNDKKQKIIQKAKRTNFRQEISKATETPQGLWRLAKWAKDKSHLSREVSKMPMLKFNDQVADTFDQKAEMLKGVFFPAPPPADLSDIEGSFYPTSPHCPIIITKSEVSTALSRLNSDKAPGPDGISNRILKACSEKLVELLTPLF